MRGPLVVLLTVTALVPLRAVPESVRIATVVTDLKGAPVAGLTLKDFELKEDGVVQKLVAVEARRAAPRRLAILLDEFHVDPADTSRVREALAQLVDATLRPDDAAVVLKPLDPLTTIRLTPDRAAIRDAISSFEGRKGNLAPRSVLEEETLGRAPALVEAGRAQVVLSALRALTGQLGSASGRSAVLFVSEGFAAQPRRLTSRGLPDAGVVERFANRYDVPIYAFDPRAAVPLDEDPGAVMLAKLVSETGGTLTRGPDLAGNLTRVLTDIDSGYVLTYQPSHADDGQYHPVQVTMVRGRADARTRSGYVSAPSEETRRAMREASANTPALPMRMLRRSPLIDVWSGVTSATSSQGRVVVTWEPPGPPGPTKSAAARVTLKATTKDGKVLFDGTLAPVRVGEGADPTSPDRAEFDAPTGRVQLDFTILGIAGNKIDYDARDLEVPTLTSAVPLLLPAILIATQSAREFRMVAADPQAAPDPSRQFRRTERILIRVAAYAGGVPQHVTARLLNRLAQPLREIDALPDGPEGIAQFDLPLAPLAPGDYFLLFTVTGPKGPVDQRMAFKITG